MNQRESEALLEQMHESSRRWARKRLAREGLKALGDYDRRLLGLDSIEEEARKRAAANLVREQEAARQRALEAQRRRAKEQDEQRFRQSVTSALRPKHIVFRNPRLQAMNQHVIDLAIKHRVNVQRGIEAAAIFATRTIQVMPVTNEQTYAVALHELGHVLSPEADSRQHRYEVGKTNNIASPKAERAAWFWALDKAIYWTREMQDEMYVSLKSYAPRATPDEAWELGFFLMSASYKICDTPWTFGELNEKQARLRACARAES